MKQKVLIVLINYNGLIDTLECLDSLRSIEDISTHTVVLDNGSFDNSEILQIQKEFPKVTCFRSDTNLGFAAGCNHAIRLGLEQYKAEFVLLLNNDTVVNPLFLKKMIAAANSDERNGIVGPKILYYSRQDFIQTTGGKFVCPLGIIWSICSDKLDSEKLFSRDRDWISGCAMLIKINLIRKIGFLNENFFQGGEDYEYCHRATSKGYKVLFEPDAIVWHKGSKSSRQKLKKTVNLKSNQKVGVVAYMNLFRAISPFPVISAFSAVLVGFPIQILGYLLMTKDNDLRRYYTQKFLRLIIRIPS